MDVTLSSDSNILFRYSISCVAYSYETVLYAGNEQLTTGPTSREQITAWKVGDLFNAIGRGEVEVPAKWKFKRPADVEIEGGKIKSLGPDTMQKLEVKIHWLESFPRQRSDADERQIDAIQAIAHRVFDDRGEHEHHEHALEGRHGRALAEANQERWKKVEEAAHELEGLLAKVRPEHRNDFEPVIKRLRELKNT